MVHGPIQSALISTGLRLASASPRAEESENLVTLLEGTLSNLVTTQRAESLPDFLESLEDVWEGVTTLRAHMGEPVLGVLEKSPASLHACSEVIREGVNNAIFHGNATDIDITVTMLSRNTVHVRVEDNGSGPSPRRTPGVGSDLLNTVSSGWNLLRTGDTTVLTANLFVANET
jgi:signal transduction histidine kinase